MGRSLVTRGNAVLWLVVGRPRRACDSIFPTGLAYIGHFPGCGCCARKWQGSDAEVLEFARTVADTAPPGALLAFAHLEVMAEQETDPHAYFASLSIRDRITGLAGHLIANLRPHVRTPEAHNLYGRPICISGSELVVDELNLAS